MTASKALGVADGAGVVGASGQRVADVQEPAVQPGDDLVVVAGGVVLARTQLGGVGPTWTLQSATKYRFLVLDDPTLGKLDSNALAF
jgi:hypothetical protein